MAAAYKGPYRVKSRSSHSYLLEGSDATEDRVAINRLKPFHTRPEEEEADLQPLPRRGRPARVAEPVSPMSPTPAIEPVSPKPSTPIYSPPASDFPPLGLASLTPRTGRERACPVPKFPHDLYYFLCGTYMQEILNYSLNFGILQYSQKSKVRYLFSFVRYLPVRSPYHFVVKFYICSKLQT